MVSYKMPKITLAALFTSVSPLASAEDPDLKINYGFPKACDSAASIDLETIPSDYIRHNEPNAYSGLVTIGPIDQEFSDKVIDYFHSVATNNSSDRPDFILINTIIGGSIFPARDIIDAMDSRHEIAVVANAGSSATVIMAHADSVYANNDATLLFHESRIKGQEIIDNVNPVIVDHLEVVTGKRDVFFAADFEKLAEYIKDWEGNEDYKNFVERKISEMEAANEYFISSYHGNNPYMTEGCAEALIGNDDVVLTAEEGLRLGLVDAVFIDGQITVRKSDPRAQVLAQR